MPDNPLYISIEKVQLLPHFPSGSAMEFFDGNIYLVGDDARHLLVMDKDYLPLLSISLFEGEEKRIPKKEKADLESSAIIQYKGASHLLISGSASRSHRERIYLFSLPAHKLSTFETFDTDGFTDRLKDMGVTEVNMEGAAAVGTHLLMSNRGNKNNPDNLIFVTSPDFFLHQKTAPVQMVKIDMPHHDFPIGISSLCYNAAYDFLFFTASVELTENAYDDGGIGDSYLGYIKNISALLHPDNFGRTSIIRPDALVNLSETSAVFTGQKIESICFEQMEGEKMIAHLVSDNDTGESTLFKVHISVK